MRSEGYGTWSVCLSVHLSARILALRATGRPMSGTNRLWTMRRLILKWPFSWNDCVPETWLENKWKSQRVVDRTRALSGRLYSAHVSCQFLAGACAMLYDPQASLWINTPSKVYSQCSVVNSPELWLHMWQTIISCTMLSHLHNLLEVSPPRVCSL